MTEPLFISTTFLEDGKPISAALEICNQLNIDGVEMGSNHCFEDDYSYIKNYAFRLLNHNYFPIPEYEFVVNIASRNDSIREQSLIHAQNAIDFSAEFGAEIYTIHPGFITDPSGEKKTTKNYDFSFEKIDESNDARQHTTNCMVTSLDKLVSYAEKKSIKLAIETEGSINHHNQLIMQTPEEYEALFQRFSPTDLGINLNIGHLILAANHFNFDPFEFSKFVQPSVVAMELSHNYGKNDDHLPLKKDAWYWPVIFDKGFTGIPRILEFRRATMAELISSISIFRSF